MTETVYMIGGLSPLQTWGLIALVFFALAGVWSLLSLCLDWLNDWLNQRAYDAQYRANEERQAKAWIEFEQVRSEIRTSPHTKASKERQVKAWNDAQEAMKHSGPRV